MRVLNCALLALGSAACAGAQHHHDPFAGSGCNCSAFCDNSCSINATKTAENVTVYRMTPFGVLDLTEKNSADAAGDVSFVISRRTQALQCEQDPNNFYCHGMVQFEGDNPNSTDLVLEMQVEWDGQFGPYLYCNDVNSSDPTGAWACKVTLDTGSNVPSYPDSCRAANYTPYENFCINGIHTARETVGGLGDCCALAEKHKAVAWQLNQTSDECTVFALYTHYNECNNTVTATYEPKGELCNCSRVHDTIGRENLTSAFGSRSSHYYLAGGQWFSHPGAGECKGQHYVGDGSGCTWRHVRTTSAINASCLYDQLDNAVIAKDPQCWDGCPQPKNKTSQCWNECFVESSKKMTPEELLEPWNTAVSRTSAGCPQVDLSSVEAPQRYKPAKAHGHFVDGVW